MKKSWGTLPTGGDWKQDLAIHCNFFLCFVFYCKCVLGFFGGQANILNIFMMERKTCNFFFSLLILWHCNFWKEDGKFVYDNVWNSDQIWFLDKKFRLKNFCGEGGRFSCWQKRHRFWFETMWQCVFVFELVSCAFLALRGENLKTNWIVTTKALFYRFIIVSQDLLQTFQRYFKIGESLTQFKIFNSMIQILDLLM